MALEIKVIESRSLSNDLLLQILGGGWVVNDPRLIVLSREVVAHNAQVKDQGNEGKIPQESGSDTQVQ